MTFTKQILYNEEYMSTIFTKFINYIIYIDNTLISDNSQLLDNIKLYLTILLHNMNIQSFNFDSNDLLKIIYYFYYICYLHRRKKFKFFEYSSYTINIEQNQLDKLNINVINY